MPRKAGVPVVAPELEFYLTKTNPDPDYPLEPPTGRSGRPGAGRQAYSLGAVDEYDKIVDDIYEFAERQYLKIDTIIQEGGAAQLEINLLHGDPVDLADQVFLFKRTIREAAFAQNCYATFMAKPLANEPGSAMHVHQSIVDAKTGKNIFTLGNGEPSKLFFSFLAGQQTYLPAAMCLIAPYVNSYRRLVPNGAAPINVEWGYDNRSAGLRVPVSPDDRAASREPPCRRRFKSLSGARGKPCLRLSRHEERARAARRRRRQRLSQRSSTAARAARSADGLRGEHGSARNSRQALLPRLSAP